MVLFVRRCFRDETGIIPLKVDIKSRMIGYWSKLVSPVTSNFTSIFVFYW